MNRPRKSDFYYPNYGIAERAYDQAMDDYTWYLFRQFIKYAIVAIICLIPIAAIVITPMRQDKFVDEKGEQIINSMSGYPDYFKGV